MPRKSNQETLGDVIERLLDVYHLRSGLSEMSIQSEWPKIVGPAIASRTQTVVLRGKKLIIEVNNAALKQELHSQREQIRDNVNEFLKRQQVEEVILR